MSLTLGTLESGGVKDDKPQIQELLAKREKGSLGKDGAPIEDLGGFPPPKARPVGLATSDFEASDMSTTKIEGYDVAIIPYKIDIIELAEFVGTRVHPDDISGVLHTLWRHDENAYQAASKRMHVLHIPKNYHDKKRSKKLSSFYQFLGSLAYGMKHKRSRLMDDISEVSMWNERYQTELKFLKDKKERVKQYAKEVGIEVEMYADDYVDGIIDRKHHHKHHKHHHKQHLAKAEMTVDQQQQDQQLHHHNLRYLHPSNHPSINNLTKQVWSFRILLETHKETKVQFEEWLTEGSERHLHVVTQQILLDKRNVKSKINNNDNNDHIHEQLNVNEKIDEKCHIALLKWKEMKLSSTYLIENDPNNNNQQGDGLIGTTKPIKKKYKKTNINELHLLESATDELKTDEKNKKTTGKRGSSFFSSMNRKQPVAVVKEEEEMNDEQSTIGNESNNNDVLSQASSAVSTTSTSSNQGEGVGGGSVNSTLSRSSGVPLDEATHVKYSAFFNQLYEDLYEPFSINDRWVPLMDQLRLDRGGAAFRDSHSESKTEVDSHGVVRLQANSDRYIDTDILAPGSIQRLRIEVVEPKLVELCKYSENNIFRDLGEIGVVTQYVYILAAPHLQRVWRGYVGRERCKKLLLHFRFLAMTAAAVEIQRMVRAAVARRLVAKLKADLNTAKVITIQKLWRGALARMLFAKLKAAKKGKVQLAASYCIQRIYRGFESRRKTKLYRTMFAREEFFATFSWAIMTLQRRVRGYLSKKQLVIKKVELKLSDRLQRVAHKYLTSGDLWGFLQQVNDDYRRYEVEQTDILKREDELAATFVDKVIIAREQQHQDGWSKYNEMSMQERNGGKGNSQTPKSRANQGTAAGPRLRRVLEAGLSGIVEGADGGVGSPQRQKEMIEVYNQTANPMTPGSRVSRNESRSSPNRPTSSVHFSPTTPNTALMSPSRGGDGHGSPSSLTSRHQNHSLMSPNAHPGLSLSSPQKSLSNPTYKSDATMPGLSFLKDIPNGLEDTVERFMKATALRVYIPKGMVPHGTTCEMAFQHFRSLPPTSLARIRWESEMNKYIAPYIEEIKQSNHGVTLIKHLLPMRKFLRICNEIKLSSELISICRIALSEIRSEGTKINGKGIKGTESKFNKINDGDVTIEQIINSGGVIHTSSKNEKEEEMKKMNKNLIKNGISEEMSDWGFQHEDSLMTDLNDQNNKNNNENNDDENNDDHEKDFTSKEDDEKVNQLVSSLREDVLSWGTLDGDIESFLTKAAFYVCPHEDDAIPGPDNLVKFAKSLIMKAKKTKQEEQDDDEEDENDEDFDINEDEDERILRKQRLKEAKEKARNFAVADLLKCRMQAAMLFAGTVSLRFRSGGIHTPKSLLRCRFDEWGLVGAASGDESYKNNIKNIKNEQDFEEKGENGDKKAKTGGIASKITPMGELRFQIELMLRIMVGNEQAKKAPGGIFSGDNEMDIQLNSMAANKQLLIEQGSLTGIPTSENTNTIAGYSKIPTFSKQNNPFLSSSDVALMKVKAPPQKQLGFDPRYQRNPWDPKAKQPRSLISLLAPQHKPPPSLAAEWERADRNTILLTENEDNDIDINKIKIKNNGDKELKDFSITNNMNDEKDKNDDDSDDSDMNELPPPEGQTFDQAERLEALHDLPPSLWSKKEYILSPSNNNSKFNGLWPNTGSRYTKVKLEDGDFDLKNPDLIIKNNVENNDNLGNKLHLSGDPSAPDPKHPDISTDYRTSGTAIRGVAAQSKFTHPSQVIGKDSDHKTRQSKRLENAQKRIHRTETANVKVNKGFEHLEPKQFHSETTGLTFSTKAERSRYEKVQKKFGEFERFSQTPQIGRDLKPQLEDSLVDVITNERDMTLNSTGNFSSFQQTNSIYNSTEFNDQDEDYQDEDDNDDYGDDNEESKTFHHPNESSSSSSHGNFLPNVQQTKQQSSILSKNKKTLMNKSLLSSSSQKKTTTFKKGTNGGKGKGKGRNKSNQNKSSLSMGGLQLDAKLQQELQELALVAQASNVMMSTSLPAPKTTTNSTMNIHGKTQRSIKTRGMLQSSSSSSSSSAAQKTLPKRFQGDSRGSSSLHIYNRQLDNGSFTPPTDQILSSSLSTRMGKSSSTVGSRVGSRNSQYRETMDSHPSSTSPSRSTSKQQQQPHQQSLHQHSLHQQSSSSSMLSKPLHSQTPNVQSSSNSFDGSSKQNMSLSHAGGGDVFWEGFDDSGSIWLAFSKVNRNISKSEEQINNESKKQTRDKEGENEEEDKEEQEGENNCVCVRVWSMVGEGTANTIVTLSEMKQYLLQPMAWMNELEEDEVNIVIERLIECLLQRNSTKQNNNNNNQDFSFLSLPRKILQNNDNNIEDEQPFHSNSNESQSSHQSFALSQSQSKSSKSSPSSLKKPTATTSSQHQQQRMLGSSPVPPLLIPARDRRKKGGDQDDDSSRLHTPQPLTSHSTSSAFLEIAYHSGRSVIRGGSSSSSTGGGGQRKSILYYEQPPIAMSGSLYAADGSFAYGSSFQNNNGQYVNRNDTNNPSSPNSHGSSDRSNSILGHEESTNGSATPSARFSQWSASIAPSTVGSTNSTARIPQQPSSPASQSQLQHIGGSGSGSNLVSLAAAPWGVQKSVSYPEGEEWVDEGGESVTESLKPYLSSDEEDNEEDDENAQDKDTLTKERNNKGNDNGNDNKKKKPIIEENIKNNPNRTSQLLDTAEAVRATLMKSEIDAAADSTDCSLLMELLAIARTMPKGIAAIHVLSRIEGLLTILEQNELEEERLANSNSSLGSRNSTGGSGSRNNSRNNGGVLTSQQNNGINQEVVNESIRYRFHAQPPQQRLRQMLADASCAESCIDTILTFTTNWKVQAVAARVLAGLARGMERNESDHVFLDLGAGRAMADAMRLFNHERVKRSKTKKDLEIGVKIENGQVVNKHSEDDIRNNELFQLMEDVSEEYRSSFREACEAFGLDKVYSERVLLDPIAALLRDKRFFSEEALKKLARM